MRRWTQRIRTFPKLPRAVESRAQRIPRSQSGADINKAKKNVTHPVRDMDTEWLQNKHRAGKSLSRHHTQFLGGIPFLLGNLHNRSLDSVIHNAVLPNAYAEPLRPLVRGIAQRKRIRRHEAHSSVLFSALHVGGNVVAHLVPAPSLAGEGLLHLVAVVHKLHLDVVTAIPTLVGGTRGRTGNALLRLHEDARGIRSDGQLGGKKRGGMAAVDEQDFVAGDGNGQYAVEEATR